ITHDVPGSLQLRHWHGGAFHQGVADGRQGGRGRSSLRRNHVNVSSVCHDLFQYAGIPVISARYSLRRVSVSTTPFLVISYSRMSLLWSLSRILMTVTMRRNEPSIST